MTKELPWTKDSQKRFRDGYSTSVDLRKNSPTGGLWRNSGLPSGRFATQEADKQRYRILLRLIVTMVVVGVILGLNLSFGSDAGRCFKRNSLRMMAWLWLASRAP